MIQRALNSKREYIANIFQYCDNWCNKCSYTLRCEFYYTHLTNSNTTDDPLFEDNEYALNASYDNQNIDLLTLDSTVLISDSKKGKSQREEASMHPCTQSSLEYIYLIDNWIDNNDSLMNEVKKFSQDKTDKNGLANLIEIIKWYQPHIYVKLARAVYAKLKETDEDCNDKQCDSNGSAKVAIIGMKKSIEAWSELLTLLKSQEDDIMHIILHLNKLLKTANDTFPNAFEFIRPGFDEK